MFNRPNCAHAASRRDRLTPLLVVLLGGCYAELGAGGVGVVSGPGQGGPSARASIGLSFEFGDEVRIATGATATTAEVNKVGQGKVNLAGGIPSAQAEVTVLKSGNSLLRISAAGQVQGYVHYYIDDESQGGSSESSGFGGGLGLTWQRNQVDKAGKTKGHWAIIGGPEMIHGSRDDVGSITVVGAGVRFRVEARARGIWAAFSRLGCLLDNPKNEEECD